MIWEVPPVWESSRRGCASAKAAKAAVSSQDGTCVGLLGCSHVPKLRLFHCREGKTNDQKHSKAHSCFSLGSTFWSMLTSKCVSQHWSKDCVKMDGPWRSRFRRSAFVAWPSLDDLVSLVCPEQFQPYHIFEQRFGHVAPPLTFRFRPLSCWEAASFCLLASLGPMSPATLEAKAERVAKA